MGMQRMPVRGRFSANGTGGIRLYTTLLVPIAIVVTTGTLFPRCPHLSQLTRQSGTRVEWTPQEIALFKENIARDRAYLRWVDRHRSPEARRQYQIARAMSAEGINQLEADIAP